MRIFLIPALAGGLIVTAGPVAAQTGFNCHPVAGRVQCDESGASQAERLNRENMERMQRQQADSSDDLSNFMEKGRRDRAEYEARKQREWRKKVATAVLEGRCDDAKRLALTNGDLDAADKAARICTPVPPPTP